MRYLVLLIILVSFSFVKPSYQVAVLKYRGGGDWYANPSSLPNLVKFCNQEMRTNISSEIATVEVGSDDLFNYPFIHMTGHGNVVFSPAEKANLQKYLKGGGFLHVDDNYGMDQFIRPILENLLPESKLVEVPFDHPLFKQPYSFPKGLPKIHEHDNQAPQAFALLYKGNVVLLYTFECDLGDGWEDRGVHQDSEEKRLQALRMGANIIRYALVGQ